MKHVMLFCEGMAGEPVAELGRRTPLEVAKTPFMDLLSKNGKVGSASFIPRALRPGGDVSALSILGFDPLEFYTGIAPLEALAMNLEQNDSQIAFRCDWVTVFDEYLVDTSAGHISRRESELLIEALNAKLSDPRVRFHSGGGYKNILLVEDPGLVDDLDELECTPPADWVGQKLARHMPRGRGADVLIGLMEKAKTILENHEINRVRIDLKENPANGIWPWGQGKKPRMPAFGERHGREGVVFSEADFVKGIAKALRLEAAENLSAAILKGDFVFVYVEAGDLKTNRDLKTQIKRIEEFDSLVVGYAVKMAERLKDVRIVVGADSVHSLSKGVLLHGHAPFLLHGAGIQEGGGVFNEKTAAQSKLVFEEGHKFMDYFLKQ